MKLCIDTNHLLCASDAPQEGKQYTQILQWLTVQDYDKTIFVDHKKSIKTLQFKDIGDTMSVFYISDRKQILWQEPLQINTQGILAALMFYKWYDETADKNYAFLYKYPVNNVNVLNTQLHFLGVNAHVNVTEKWLVVSADTSPVGLSESTTDSTAIVSFLFMLTLLYGKMDIKDTSLMHITIHLPLFGAYLKEQKTLDTLLYFLQTQWVFLQKSIVASADGVVYQIGSNDYELLWAFSQLYKGIAKIDKIPTLQRMLHSKDALITFIDTLCSQKQLTTDDTVMDTLQHNVVKLLQK